MTTQNRQPVLRCVLSNAAHPEYGQVTIPFPIPVMEYECTLECLAAMELGAPPETGLPGGRAGERLPHP